jgi:ribosome-associated translation inhibitor RaiA
MKKAFTSAVTETIVLVASHTMAAQTFERFWQKVSPKLQDGVSYLEKTDQGELIARKTFMEIVTFRDARLTRIINSCLEDFLHSDVLALIDSVQKLQDQIEKRKERINSWRLGLISAPASTLNPLRQTRARLFKRIKKEQAAIEHDLAQIESLKAEALVKLSQAKIPLTAEQLDGLLYTAEGAELAQVMAVAENIRAIQAHLSTTLDSSDNAQVKTCTGFLMLCYRIYVEIIERTISKVSGTYLEKLEELSDEANRQILRAKVLFEQSKKTSDVARNNMQINARTISLISLYRDHLKKRLTELERLRKEMVANYELSLNTFRTVKVGSELLSVIAAGEKDLEAIFSFEPPQLKSIYTDGLADEFELITRKLKGKES